MGFDSSVCAVAHNNAIGASWVTVPGPLGKAGYTAIPVFEGNAPTNHITSTECGQDCAFVSKKMMATALVSSRGARAKGWSRGLWLPLAVRACVKGQRPVPPAHLMPESCCRTCHAPHHAPHNVCTARVHRAGRHVCV
jgi:hypothetical protein